MPATMNPATTGKAHPARQIALSPYLAQLHGWLEQLVNVHPDHPARISVGTNTVTLEGWDHEQLRLYFDTETGLDGVRAELVAHSIAVVLKTTFDVGRLKEDKQRDSESFYALQGELMLDSALGIAVLHETQTMINELVQSGSIIDAKALSLFRHQIIRAINSARQCIADSDYHQAESLATTLGGPPVDDAVAEDIVVSTTVEEILVEPSEVAETTPETAPEPEPLRRPSRRKKQPRAVTTPGANFSVTMGLTVCLIATAVCFAITVGAPAITDQPTARILRADLVNPDAFVDLVALPPSVYVTIDTENWNSLDDRDRRQLIDSLGIRAESAGYSGVLLKTLEGRPVARWLETRGYELIDYTEPRF